MISFHANGDEPAHDFGKGQFAGERSSRTFLHDVGFFCVHALSPPTLVENQVNSWARGSILLTPESLNCKRRTLRATGMMKTLIRVSVRPVFIRVKEPCGLFRTDRDDEP
jgi:hypothetical protein